MVSSETPGILIEKVSVIGLCCVVVVGVLLVVVAGGDERRAWLERWSFRNNGGRWAQKITKATNVSQSREKCIGGFSAMEPTSAASGALGRKF